MTALRLNSWLVSQGGVRDAGGELRHILGRYKDRPGLVSSRGMALDDAALRAWEEGYFPEHGATRPSINDLLDLIAQDSLGRCPVYPVDGRPEERDQPIDPAAVCLEKIIRCWLSGAGKKKAMRPLMREAMQVMGIAA